MVDIFISYASENRDRVRPLAHALEKHGWSVWWDRDIPPGKTYALVIEEAIEAAKCVVVLWSNESVASDWVQNEAAEGARKKILVPALIDAVTIPFEFRRIQAAGLTDWNADSSHGGLTVLMDAITAIVAPRRKEDKPAQPPQDSESQAGPKSEFDVAKEGARTVPHESEIARPGPEIAPQTSVEPSSPARRSTMPSSKLAIASGVGILLVVVFLALWFTGIFGSTEPVRKTKPAEQASSETRLQSDDTLEGIFERMEKGLKAADEKLFRTQWHPTGYKENLVGGSGIEGADVFRQGSREGWFIQPRSNEVRGHGSQDQYIVTCDVVMWKSGKIDEVVYTGIVRYKGNWAVLGIGDRSEVSQLVNRYSSGKPLQPESQ